jgi:hypothetical protein
LDLSQLVALPHLEGQLHADGVTVVLGLPAWADAKAE